MAASKADILAAALAYASRGWAVVPLQWVKPDGGCSCKKGTACGRSSGKHPRTEHGYLNATTDIAKIREWFRRMPLAGVGIKTGIDTGLAMVGIAVVDIDERNGGLESLASLAAEHGTDFLHTVRARSGGGGPHLYYAITEPLETQNSILPGIDLEADGGNGGIVAAPSIHLSGSVYAWEPNQAPGDIDLLPLPDWFRGLAAKAKREHRATVQRIITTGDGNIPIGERNSFCGEMARELHRQGRSEAEVVYRLVGIITLRSIWDDSFTVTDAEQLARRIGAKIEPVTPPPEPLQIQTSPINSGCNLISDAAGDAESSRRALLETVTEDIPLEVRIVKLYLALTSAGTRPLDPEDEDATAQRIATVLHIPLAKARGALKVLARSEEQPDSPIVVEPVRNAGALMPAKLHYLAADGSYITRFPKNFVHVEPRPMKILRFNPKCDPRKTWGGRRAGAGRRPKGAAACPKHPESPVAVVTTIKTSVQSYCTVDGGCISTPTVTTSVRHEEMQPNQLDSLTRDLGDQVENAPRTRAPTRRPADIPLNGERRHAAATAVLRVAELFPREDRGRPRGRCVSCGGEDWIQVRPGEWECKFCGTPPGAGSDWVQATS
jgi:Bifunctional DNA primase/polymerase, N-terminal